MQPSDLARLAAANALASLLSPGTNRREALWHVYGLPRDQGDLFARYRREARTALFVLVDGKVERSGQVVNLKAESYDFH